MKQKISFDITIGSEYPVNLSPWESSLPRGGIPYTVIIDFEYIPGEKDNITQAEVFLKEKIKKDFGDVTYHIWYWTMIECEKTQKIDFYLV